MRQARLAMWPNQGVIHLALEVGSAAMGTTRRGTASPVALVMLKDGHVGSEWFAEVLSRQPSTRFIFEMGACITGSLSSKIAYVAERRGCACAKEDCQAFKKDFEHAPCLDSPSARSCTVLGGSHLSFGSDSEVEQWHTALANSTGVFMVVQTRSNLVKWAWSFLRTGAAHRFSYWNKQQQKQVQQQQQPQAQQQGNASARYQEQNHLRFGGNRSRPRRIAVRPEQQNYHHGRSLPHYRALTTSCATAASSRSARPQPPPPPRPP